MANTLIHRAQQGDAAAIAALINRHAKDLGVTAQVSLQQQRLHIILEGQEPPPQLFWSHYLKRSLSRLGTRGVVQLYLCGQVLGAQRPAWDETVDLLTSPRQPDLNPTVAPTEQLPDAMPVTQRYSVPMSTTLAPHRRSTSSRRIHPPKTPHRRSSHPVKQRPRLKMNWSLALLWGIGTMLLGAGTGGRYYLARETPSVMAFARGLPQLELTLACVAAVGYGLGWLQARLLRDWVDASELWIPAGLVGAVMAYIGVVLVGGDWLALPIMSLPQCFVLQRWVKRAYLWTLAHLAMAIATWLALPLVVATAVTLKWGRNLSYGLGMDHELVVKLALLWVVYSVGSAIAMGRLFHSRPAGLKSRTF